MTPTDLRVFRAKHNLTQSQLAERLKISNQTISDYENEKREIPLTFEYAIKHLEESLNK